jgi:hypothetical protein
MMLAEEGVHEQGKGQGTLQKLRGSYWVESKTGTDSINSGEERFPLFRNSGEEKPLFISRREGHFIISMRALGEAETPANQVE